MKKLVFSTFFVLQVIFLYAQSATGVAGKIVDSKSQKALQNVHLHLKLIFAAFNALMIINFIKGK